MSLDPLSPQQIADLRACLEEAVDDLPTLSGHLIDNARDPYEKWAAGFCTDVEGACGDALKALDNLSDESGRLWRERAEDAEARITDLIPALNDCSKTHYERSLEARVEALERALEGVRQRAEGLGKMQFPPRRGSSATEAVAEALSFARSWILQTRVDPGSSDNA